MTVRAKEIEREAAEKDQSVGKKRTKGSRVDPRTQNTWRPKPTSMTHRMGPEAALKRTASRTACGCAQENRMADDLFARKSFDISTFGQFDVTV